MGEPTTTSAADRSPHAAALAVLLAEADPALLGRGDTGPAGHRAVAAPEATAGPTVGLGGTIDVDLKLADVGTRLQYSHRGIGGDRGCAAGCAGPLPCRGHRLGAHVLWAATGPWHVRYTAWTDLVSSEVLVPGGVLPHDR